MAHRNGLTFLVNPLMPVDTFMGHIIISPKMPIDPFDCHNGPHEVWVVFLALQTWNSYFCFKSPVAMRELSLGVPTLSSRRSHDEVLSSTMLTPSSWTKIAVHICVRVYKAARVKSDLTILGADSRKLTFSFAPCSYINFTLIFLDWTSCLHRSFHCGYTTANNKSYQKSFWITDICEKILTEAVSAVRNDYKA